MLELIRTDLGYLTKPNLDYLVAQRILIYDKDGNLGISGSRYEGTPIYSLYLKTLEDTRYTTGMSYLNSNLKTLRESGANILLRGKSLTPKKKGTVSFDDLT